MTPLHWSRTVRTSSSERFLGRHNGRDVAAVDLHHLPNGTVTGTVFLLKEAGWTEAQVPSLLTQLDEELLPGVDLDSGGLSFTVVLGEVLGNFEASQPVLPNLS